MTLVPLFRTLCDANLVTTPITGSFVQIKSKFPELITFFMSQYPAKFIGATGLLLNLTIWIFLT